MLFSTELMPRKMRTACPQHLGAQAPDGVFEQLDAPAHGLGLGRGETAHLLLEAARFGLLARGQAGGERLEPGLESGVRIDAGEGLLAPQLPGLPDQLAHARLAAEIALGEPFGPGAAGGEAVGGQALRQRGERGHRHLDGLRGIALERDDAGDAAAEHGGPERRHHHRPGGHGGQAAAEVDRSAQPAGGGRQEGLQSSDKRSQHTHLLCRLPAHRRALPGGTAASGPISTGPASVPAASSIPWESTPMSFAGRRLAMTTICRPTRLSGA